MWALDICLWRATATSTLEPLLVKIGYYLCYISTVEYKFICSVANTDACFISFRSLLVLCLLPW